VRLPAAEEQTAEKDGEWESSRRFFTLGGAEQATLDVLRCLDPARFRVVGTAVATAALRSDMMVRQYEELGPVVYTREDAVRLTSECDIVLCWGVDVGPFLPNIGRRPAVVVVGHSTCDMHYAVEIHARCSPTVDRFVAVSRAALPSIPRDRRAQTVVIPHAVDPERITASRTRDEVLRTWGIDPRLTVVGFLGRLAPEKRPPLFVDAIAELPDGHAGVMVIDVSVDGPEDRRMQLGRKAIVEPVIDVDIKVNRLAGDLVERVGPEMDDFDDSFQGTPAVDAGRLGPSPVIKDHRDTLDCHDSAPRR